MRSGVIGMTTLLLLAACTGAPPAPPTSSASPGLRVTSPSFAEGSEIPSRLTCTGEGQRPVVAWTGATAAAWALVVDDPDAPGGDFYHWVVVDMPAGTTEITADVPGTQLKNSRGDAGWTPPCPPSGTHHYRFTVYGLSAPTGLAASASLDGAFAKISALTVAQGRLTGTVAHTG